MQHSCSKQADGKCASEGGSVEVHVCGAICSAALVELCNALFALKVLCLNAKFICELPGQACSCAVNSC